VACQPNKSAEQTATGHASTFTEGGDTQRNNHSPQVRAAIQ
jgi:hypothetical protein